MDGETIAGAGYPKLCICCREAVRKGETVVESVHGPYHGSPRNCVEGRDEVEL